MEGKLQTSFIPKKPLTERSVSSGASFNFFSIIGWFIFLVVLAASVGVFLWENYIKTSIDARNGDLKTIMDKFNPSSVDELTQLDSRLKAANALLNNHLAFSTLLDLISTKTIESVQFTNLTYSNDGSKITLDLSGRAPDFASVALQSDTFSSQPYLKNQVFSGLGLDQNGGVLFKVNAAVDPSAISYKSSAAATTAATPAASVVVPTNAASSTNQSL